jgi:hypothetical protein
MEPTRPAVRATMTLGRAAHLRRYVAGMSDGWVADTQRERRAACSPSAAIQAGRPDGNDALEYRFRGTPIDILEERRKICHEHYQY